MRKGGSILGGAWDGVTDWMDNQVESAGNWINDNGYRTNEEISSELAGLAGNALADAMGSSMNNLYNTELAKIAMQDMDSGLLDGLSSEKLESLAGADSMGMALNEQDLRDRLHLMSLSAGGDEDAPLGVDLGGGLLEGLDLLPDNGTSDDFIAPIDLKKLKKQLKTNDKELNTIDEKRIKNNKYIKRCEEREKLGGVQTLFNGLGPADGVDSYTYKLGLKRAKELSENYQNNVPDSIFGKLGFAWDAVKIVVYSLNGYMIGGIADGAQGLTGLIVPWNKINLNKARSLQKKYDLRKRDLLNKRQLLRGRYNRYYDNK